MLKDVLRESDPVSMMPWFMAQADIAAGLMEMVRGVDLGGTARFGACWIKQRMVSAAGRKFLQLLRDHDSAQSRTCLTTQDAASRDGRLQAAS